MCVTLIGHFKTRVNAVEKWHWGVAVNAVALHVKARWLETGSYSSTKAQTQSEGGLHQERHVLKICANRDLWISRLW